MKPRILLSVKSKKEFYFDAINNCGGIAIEANFSNASSDYDGLILSGGPDIHPSYYGEEINGSVNIDDERDKFEMELIKKFIDTKKPIMGICRGCQLLNIYFGGTLHQDIENSDEHSSSEGYEPVHYVKSQKNSFIYDLYGNIFPVNSLHHQAVNKLGDSMEVTAISLDNKTVEGIRHKTLPVFGVQWHPERMCFSKKREDTVDGKLLFEYYINMCYK